jgi:hypothetical protein
MPVLTEPKAAALYPVPRSIARPAGFYNKQLGLQARPWMMHSSSHSLALGGPHIPALPPPKPCPPPLPDRIISHSHPAEIMRLSTTPAGS